MVANVDPSMSNMDWGCHRRSRVQLVHQGSLVCRLRQSDAIALGEDKAKELFSNNRCWANADSVEAVLRHIGGAMRRPRGGGCIAEATATVRAAGCIVEAAGGGVTCDLSQAVTRRHPSTVSDNALPAPFPHISDRVVQAEAVGPETSHRCVHKPARSRHRGNAA